MGHDSWLFYTRGVRFFKSRGFFGSWIGIDLQYGITRQRITSPRYRYSWDTIPKKLVHWGVPYFLYPLFCNVHLILHDFRVLKLQNKGPPLYRVSINLGLKP